MRTRVGDGRRGLLSMAFAFLLVAAGPGCEDKKGVTEEPTPPHAASHGEQDRPPAHPHRDGTGQRRAHGASPGEPGLVGAASGSRQAAQTAQRGQTPPPRKTPLIVHEWGTFTSMSGSDGVVLSGMHWTEEALPWFVHGRAPHCGIEMKCVEEGYRLDVTQKLETPVLYFYGEEQTKLTVDVAFPLGVIGEWYPNASAMAPPYAPCSSWYCTPKVPAGGSMQWQVELLPADKAPASPVVGADSVWKPSRHVKANPVRRVGGCAWEWKGCYPVEEEMFIFYRGLGSFSLPIETRARVDGSVTVTNSSDDALPAAFLLRTDGERGAFVGPVFVPANSSVDFEAPPSDAQVLAQRDPGQYIDELGTGLVEALVQAGLYEDEAWALVHTWSRSYFLSPGLRLLYVVPRTWTDELLPLSIEPEPDRVERVLVGRVEILTPEDERALMEDVDRWVAEEFIWWDYESDMRVFARSRFAEPKVRRAMALASTPEQLMFLEAFLEFFYYPSAL